MSADLPSGLEAIQAWGMRSSNGATKYEIVLWNTGHLSCDCPGWTFKRKDNISKYGHERWCKHLTEKWDEATRAFVAYSGGRPWQVKRNDVDDQPDVIRSVKVAKAKPVADEPISLRPTRAFDV